MLMCALLMLVAAPSYYLVNFYNTHMAQRYRLPLVKSVLISLGLAIVASGLLGVDFEGAAISWLLTIFILHCGLLLAGLGVFTLVKYLSDGT
jgi:hypothetical protein